MSSGTSDNRPNVLDEVLVPPPGIPTDKPLPETGPEQAPKQDDTTAQKKRRGASVFTYLVVLFAAAFLMLLMAYFVQRRNNDAILLDMQAALPTIELAKQLQEENQQLKEENTSLQQQAKRLEKTLKELDRELEDAWYASEQAGSQISLLTTVWLADIKFSQGDYENCADDLLRLFASDQAEPLSSVFNDSGEEESTASRVYERLSYIRDELTAMGYLEEGVLMISDALGESGIAGVNAGTDTETIVDR